MSKITSVIPTYNNLPFLKLTVTSIRQNCYYNDHANLLYLLKTVQMELTIGWMLTIINLVLNII